MSGRFSTPRGERRNRASDPGDDAGASSSLLRALPGEAILDACPEAIIVLDDGGRIVFVNGQAEILFGYARAELLGRSAGCLLASEEAVAPAGTHGVFHLGSGSPPASAQRRDVHVRGKNGMVFPAEVLLGSLPAAVPPLVLATFRNVAARRKIERDLRQSEALQRSIAENVPHSYLAVVDRSMIVRYVSGQELRVQHLDPAQYVGRHVSDVFAPFGEEVVATMLAAHARTFAGEEWSFELHVNDQDQLYRWVPMRNEEGGVERILVVVENITNRQQAAAALAASEERLRHILDSMLSFVALFAPDGTVLEVNRASLEAANLRAEDVLGRPLADTYWFSHDETAAAQMRAALQQAAAGAIVRQDFSVRLADRVATFDGIIGPLRNADGRIVELVGSATDVTERQRSEALLAGQKRVLEMIAAHAPLRETLEALLRCIEEQSPGMLCSILLLEDGVRVRHGAAPRLPDAFNAAIDGLAIGPNAGSCGTAAYRREPVFVADITTDPLWAPYRDLATPFGLRACWSTPILDPAGDVLGTFAIYHREPRLPEAPQLRLIEVATHTAAICLTRHRDEGALRESEERFRQVVENIREIFWMTNADQSRVLYVSPNYEEVWGQPRAVIYAQPNQWLEPVHPDDRERVLAAAARDPAVEFDEEYRIVRPDGVVRWIHARAFPVRDARGVVYRIVGVAEDVTRRVQLEEQLRHAQKMDGIGQLSGGLAHDFNNLLTVIQGHVTLLELSGEPGEAAESVHEIKVAAGRAANLTRQLLTFSRRQAMVRRPIDLGAVVMQMSQMLERLLGETIRIERRLAPRPLTVFADPGMLEQVLLNLAVNARDAMRDGGVLLLATSVGPGGPGGDELACLTITDTGTGIAPEHLPRIFEPFFSTKPVGQGTGLGLATVYGIVHQHGGRIEVQSAPGQGTTFRVFLPGPAPGLDSAPGPETSPVPAVPAERGRETILLVEDERALRSLVARLLRRSGYAVLEAANGPDALKLWERNSAGIALVITDLVMPEGMSGFDLAEYIARAAPQLPVIYISGYSPELPGRAAELQPGINFLAKPFDHGALMTAVRHALERPAR